MRGKVTVWGIYFRWGSEENPPEELTLTVT